MILTAIILGATAIVGAGLIASYWNNLVGWLKRAIAKVKEIIEHVVYGTKIMIKQISEGLKQISKHYSQDEIGRWKETVVSRTIPESEVPKEIREKAAKYYGEEIDVTNELELKLS